MVLKRQGLIQKFFIFHFSSSSKIKIDNWIKLNRNEFDNY